MPETNRFQRLGFEAAERLVALDEKAEKEARKTVPFGFERVGAAAMRKALALSQEERLNLIKKPDAMAQLRRLYGGRYA